MHEHAHIHIFCVFSTGIGVLHKAPIERALCKATRNFMKPLQRGGFAQLLRASLSPSIEGAS